MQRLIPHPPWQVTASCRAGWSSVGELVSGCTADSVFGVVTPLKVWNVCLFRKSGTFLQLSKWNELQNFKSNLKFALSREVQGQSSHWLEKSTINPINPAHSLFFFFFFIDPIKPVSASAWVKWAFTFGDWLLAGKICGKSAAQEIENSAPFFFFRHKLIFAPPKQNEK